VPAPPEPDLATPEGRCRSLLAAAATLGVEVQPAGAALLVRYLDAMLAENLHVNLTAIRDPGQALVLHALDSLALGLALAEPPARLLDLGTGNGFPGVAALALWPGCRVTLCDRTQKKVAAVARALAAAAVAGAGAEAVDAAQAPALRPEWRQAFAAVTVRAVGAPAAVAALASPLLAPGGALVLWLDAGAHAPGVKGFEPARVREYALPAPAARTRRVACYRRIRS
jgi:16S rRNA (guanine527-N7)-methyltransferase